MARRVRRWRVHSAVTSWVTCNEVEKYNAHKVLLKITSGQLPDLGSIEAVSQDFF